MIKFYFTALKKLIRVINLVFNLMKKKIKKMAKYTGQEGWVVSKQSYEALVKSHEDRFGETAEFTKYVTVGVDVMKKVMETDPTACRIMFGFDGHQQTVIVTPVDENGIELAVKAASGMAMKDAPGDGKGSSGPHCPSSC